MSEMSLYLIGWRVGLPLTTALGERERERGRESERGGERKSERGEEAERRKERKSGFWF